MKGLHLLTLVSLALLAGPASSFAQFSGWTTPCSAGATIERRALGLYSVFQNYLTFRNGTTGSVTARYDVTNNSIPPSSNPPWKNFELACFDNDPTTAVKATLYQYTPCQQLLALCTINSTDIGQQCPRCQELPPFDFVNNVYWVEVTISRTDSKKTVRADSLRIFP